MKKKTAIPFKPTTLLKFRNNRNIVAREYVVDNHNSIICIRFNYTSISDYSFLKELKGLTQLDLRSNNLSDVSFIVELPNLRFFEISGNSAIKEPERQILELGTKAIRNYFLEKEKGTDFLYEAKVLFVGEPDAGKTSLMTKLINPKHKVKKEEILKSTQGINIKENWEFTCKKTSNKKYYAHLWDFGGQQIQHFIHQFFLTDRSLYLLLIDDRKDNQHTDYWFKTIKLLGEGSPVLIVRNIKKY